jgi:hypothetical protein
MGEREINGVVISAIFVDFMGEPLKPALRSKDS